MSRENQETFGILRSCSTAPCRGAVEEWRGACGSRSTSCHRTIRWSQSSSQSNTPTVCCLVWGVCVCVSNRGRQDSHVPHPEPSSGASIISFDFGYLNRLDDDGDPKLTALFVYDQHTKLVHVVPTPAKGGRYLPYLVTELFYTQHKVVTLRTDSEPSILSLLQKVLERRCHPLEWLAMLRLPLIGSHQSNGAAEKTVHLVRQLANCYMQQLEHNGGAPGPVFKSMHPVVAWSLIHAAWVRNHFAVQGGQTPFERAFDRSYNGRVCAFGEVVLGYVRSSKKGVAGWRKGIWLTKSTNNDVHVIAFGEHVLCKVDQTFAK